MYIAQLGNLLILLALVMTAIAGASFLITALGRKNLSGLGIKAFILQIFFVAIAVIVLYYLFFTHDYSVKYVYEYSSSDLPFFYLLSSFWGGQEGTYLLWIFLSSLFGVFILLKGKLYTTWGMFFHSLVHIFLLIILLTLSPFKLLDFPAADGAGLNPLLQDPWMVAHPPVMFVAFAMAGVPFAFALAALIKRDYSQWLKTTYPFVAITSFALIVANVLGGYWAYKTLGWGGYWAWDPVENTSFVPWVVSIGLIHGMIVEKRSGALRRSNLLLSALIFFLVIYGTFLTRSGVLADFSVHSFVDLGLNGILIGFLLAFALLTLVVFSIFRSPDIIGKPLNYNIFSRDFILFVGLALFTILGIVILFWSSLPLITRYFTSNPSAAEVSTYNAFAFPFAIIISLFLTLSPVLIGTGIQLPGLKKNALMATIISLVSASALFGLSLIGFTMAITFFIYLAVILIYALSKTITAQLMQSLGIGVIGTIVALVLGVKSLEYLFFIFAALAAAAAHLNIIFKYIASRPELVGGHLSHFGFGLMLIGILASSAFSVNEQVVIPRDQSKKAFGYDISYNGTAGSIKDQNNEILLTLSHDGKQIQARPKFFFAERMNGMMKKPYIDKNLFYDLYLAPQDIQEMPNSGGLILHKGEQANVGDFAVRFINFDMGSHGTSSGISVGATLEVEYKGTKEIVTPRMVSGHEGSGMQSEPAKLFSGQNYDIKIEKILAGDGAVMLAIPGLVESGPPDRLILDISRKPAINLLWLGTIFIFLGMIIVIYYRFQ
jgi:cytochrome c-type biogenesis protein CcmF